MSKKNEQVRFVDYLPSRAYSKWNWGKITSELRKSPGDWAIVEPEEGFKPSRNSATSASNSLRKGEYSGVNPGEFEAVTRGNTVYARYIGKNGEYA